MKKWYPIKWERTEEAKKIRRENMKKGRDYNPHSMKQPKIDYNGIVGALTTTDAKNQLIILIDKKYDKN